MQASDSEDSDQELFPIPPDQGFTVNLNYDDPLMVSGLLRAVIENDLAKIMLLISQGKSANINDNHGNTPLHVAVILNRSQILDFLLTIDARVNSRNFYGETALFLAVKRGNLALVKKLIQANANVNLSNTEEITPLHIAVKYPEIVLVLIENGAELDAQDYSGETPLHEAVSEKCIETIYMLLYYNADANVPCSNNLTPFMKAIIAQNEEVQRILLDYVVDFNTTTKQDMTILNLALTHSCPFVEDIIMRGGDINYEHETLNTFMMCLHVPNVNTFKLIWPGFRYQDTYKKKSYLELLFSYLEIEQAHEFLTVIIWSGNLEPIFHCFDFFSMFKFLKQLTIHDRKAWLQITSQLICLYLCQGNVLQTDIVDQLIQLFGFNDLVYICLHMDLEGFIFSHPLALVLCHTELSMSDYKRKLRSVISTLTIPQYEALLPHVRVPGMHHNECAKEELKYLETLSEFPSLVELSRNVTRDHLVTKFQLVPCKWYYSFVQNLPIAAVYRNILTFRKGVYENVHEGGRVNNNKK